MENNYVDTLDYLLKIKSEKKKKEPSKIERDRFCTAWIKLAISEGYSEQAERYLYNGSSYCGAKPFKAYIDQADNKQEAIMAFFTGKMYGANADITFRLLSHLFALLLNDKNTAKLASVVVMRFPLACLNKYKKRLGTIEAILLKYFFAELDPNMILLPLKELVVKKPVFITDFIASMETVLENINPDGLSKNTLANIAKVKKWIEDYRTVEDITQSDAPVKSEVPVAVPVVEPPKPAVTSLIEPVPTDDKATYLVDLLGKLGKVASAIRIENIQRKNKIDVLTSALEVEQEKLRVANQQISDQSETITALRQKLMSAEGDILVLKQTLTQRETEIAKKDAEIAERIKMADVLSRDRTKQADEALQRLASRIRIEYRDFQDAIDFPMSCDLGENLRLQLQSIFDILEKGGMKIK